MNVIKIINVIYVIIIMQKIFAYFVKSIYVSLAQINVNLVDILFAQKIIVYLKIFYVKIVKI